jgi:hypothetical protein
MGEIPLIMGGSIKRSESESDDHHITIPSCSNYCGANLIIWRAREETDAEDRGGDLEQWNAL